MPAATVLRRTPPSPVELKTLAERHFLHSAHPRSFRVGFIGVAEVEPALRLGSPPVRNGTENSNSARFTAATFNTLIRATHEEP